MSEPTPTPPADQAAQPPATPETDTTDWKAEARKWEARAKENRTAAEKLAQLEDANKSETEKLADKLTQAEQRAQEAADRYQHLTKKQAITEAAVAAQTTDVETVVLYLTEAITVDDDGNPQGVDKAIKDLAKRKPHLFRATPEGSRDASATGVNPKTHGTTGDLFAAFIENKL